MVILEDARGQFTNTIATQDLKKNFGNRVIKDLKELNRQSYKYEKSERSKNNRHV